MIRKVWAYSFSGQLAITIPRDQGILEGDFVKVIKAIPKMIEGVCKFKIKNSPETICNKKLKK